MFRQLQFYRSPTLSWDEAREHHQRFLILWLSLPIMMGFTLLGGKQQTLSGLACSGPIGACSILLAASGGHLAATKPPTGPTMAVGVRIISSSSTSNRPPAPAAGSPATAGKLLSLFGGFVPVEQDGSTELIDTGQLNRSIAAAPAVMAALNHAEFVFTNEYYLGGAI